MAHKTAREFDGCQPDGLFCGMLECPWFRVLGGTKLPRAYCEAYGAELGHSIRVLVPGGFRIRYHVLERCCSDEHNPRRREADIRGP